MDDMVITRSHVFLRINPPQDRSRETLYSFELSSEQIKVVARGEFEETFTDIVAGDELIYFSRLVNPFSSNAHCALGRSDGSEAGTFTLTRVDPSYPRLYYLSNNELFSCGFEVNIVNGDVAVFKRIRKRSGSPRPGAFEIWRTEGQEATTRFVATAFDASGTDYDCTRTFFYTSVIEDSSRQGFQSGRQLFACWMSSVYINGHLWVTNYEQSPDRVNFKQVISTINITTGAVRRVVEGEWNVDTVYRPVGGRMLLEKRKLGTLGSFDRRVVQRTYFAAKATGSELQKKTEYREATFLGSVGKQAFIAVLRNNSGNRVLLQSINLGARTRTQTAAYRSNTTRSASRSLLLATHRNGVVYFCAETDQIPRDGISSLWRSNGKPGGTRKVLSRIGRTEGRETDQQACRDVRVDDRFIYYTRYDVRSGLELWKADLNGANAALFVDFARGQRSSSPVEMNLVNGRLFVAASLTGNRSRVPIAVSPNGSWEALNDGIEVERVVGNENNVVLFQASVRNGGQDVSELWQTDGTRRGTRRAINGRVSIRRDDTFPDIVTNVVTLNGDRYFFGSYTRSSGGRTTRGLHRLKAGRQQPELVKEYDLLDSSRLFYQLLVHRNSLYLGLISNVFTEGSSLVWRIDPDTGKRDVIAETEEPTGLNGSDIGAIVSWNNQLYFYTTVQLYRNDTLEQQWQIWRSTGEPRTSKRIHTERRATGPRFSSRLFLPTPNKLWFIMQSDQKGNELWQITR